MEPERPITGSGLRTPRAAGVAGILFSVLLGVALVLIIVSQPPDPAKPGAWLSDPARRDSLVVALNLVPFAGIAFLWFIGVVRDRIGQLEAAAGSAAASTPSTLDIARRITSLLLRLYAMRMAAVFTMSAATITLRTRVVPRWIGIAGIAVAVVLLVSVGLSLWVELLFPAWILLLSVDILRTGLRRSAGASATATDAA